MAPEETVACFSTKQDSDMRTVGELFQPPGQLFGSKRPSILSSASLDPELKGINLSPLFLGTIKILG